MIAEGFDVAIRMGNLPDSQLRSRKLGTTSVGLYASPAYAERVGPPKTPKSLASHECIRLAGPVEAESHWTLVRGRHEEHVAVRGRFIANSMRFQLELAERGVGIVAVDNGVARSAVQAGRLVRVLAEWSAPLVPVHALTPSKLLPAKTKVFLECLTEHLRLEQTPR
jgi:DNA-binding transcriptional LysR family regulator